MNIDATKTNAAANLTGQSNRRPSRAYPSPQPSPLRYLFSAVAVLAVGARRLRRFSVARTRGLYGKAVSQEIAIVKRPEGRAPSQILVRALNTYSLRAERLPGGQVRGTWHVLEFLHGYRATRFACAPVFVRRAPAFAPLHRFINCLLAEASDRTE